MPLRLKGPPRPRSPVPRPRLGPRPRMPGEGPRPRPRPRRDAVFTDEWDPSWSGAKLEQMDGGA